MLRRDFVKTMTLSAAAGAAAMPDEAQAASPFDMPTARFDPKLQHELPPWAFLHELKAVPVPLPTAIGTYDALAGKPVFGNTDNVPIGDCFHGIAREWGETPQHWEKYGCNAELTGSAGWEDKRQHFGNIESHDGSGPIANWAGFNVKCYKIPILEHYAALTDYTPLKARLYTYAGKVPGPTLRMRIGEPAVVRFENHLEAETSVHLHGGHSPSHSDGFPTFYILQGKARDYFYPNIVPLYRQKNGADEETFLPDVGESQSTMWYHDHAMDATAHNVAKGLAGFAICLGEEELQLIRDRVLPGYGPDSTRDETCLRYGTLPQDPNDPSRNLSFEHLLASLEDPANPGFFRPEKVPYFNPFDIPLVLQDKVIDRQTGQIAYDLTDHNGYIGDTFFVNGQAWPKLSIRNRKYRLRVLDGSNARVFRLRLMKAEDFWKARQFGINDNDETAGDFKDKYESVSQPFLRIGKDSWLWDEAVEFKTIILTMANRADLIVDFGALAKGLQPGQEQEFVLVNTMPQFDGRGPKPKLEPTDPRVFPVPFDTPGQQFVELNRPIGLMKFVVRYAPPGTAAEGDPEGDAEAEVKSGTKLILSHRRIRDEEIDRAQVVREFSFERGKGAWQINGRFYDPYLCNATPLLDGAEEWVLRNGGGGWWHPIHIHLESHQLISYEPELFIKRVRKAVY